MKRIVSFAILFLSPLTFCAYRPILFRRVLKMELALLHLLRNHVTQC